MLRLALLFVIIALIAAALGYLPIAGMAFDVAKILFFVFLVLAVIALIWGYRGRPLDRL